MEWRLIESAPRDGTHFLGYDPSLFGRWIVWWEDGGWYIDAGSQDGSGYKNMPVTHWMPLPAPPTLT
jgi:hypothetical protein